MVSPLERPPSEPSPSFDSVDLAPDDDRSLAARLDRALTRLDELRDRPGASAAMAVGAVALLAGAWWLGRTPDTPDDLAIPMVSTVAAGDNADSPAAGGLATDASAGVGVVVEAPSESTTSTAPVEVLVHVAGAVTRPGIVRLEAGDRIVDAIDGAGGPLPEAEIHRLNLAAPVADGMQIRVPTADETVDHPAGVPPPVQPGAADDGSGAGAPVAALVDLNQADTAQLETLHGIGPALAAAIITWRTESGPFATIDQLLDVPGIGPATLDGLIDQVTV